MSPSGQSAEWNVKILMLNCCAISAHLSLERRGGDVLIYEISNFIWLLMRVQTPCYFSTHFDLQLSAVSEVCAPPPPHSSPPFARTSNFSVLVKKLLCVCLAATKCISALNAWSWSKKLDTRLCRPSPPPICVIYPLRLFAMNYMDGNTPPPPPPSCIHPKAGKVIYLNSLNK